MTFLWQILLPTGNGASLCPSPQQQICGSIRSSKQQSQLNARERRDVVEIQTLNKETFKSALAYSEASIGIFLSVWDSQETTSMV